MLIHRSTRRCVLRVAMTVGLLAAAIAPTAVWSPQEVTAADSAVVTHPEGINLRESPGYDGAILGTLEDGTWLGLRTDYEDTVLDADGETRWWPVSTPLGDGWVAGFSIALDGWAEDSTGEWSEEAASSEGEGEFQQWESAGDEWSESAASGDEGSSEQSIDSVDGEYTGGEMAWVSEESGANFRAEPGVNSDVLWTVGYGTEVMLRLASSETVWADGSRWWPVTVGESNGWIAGETLSPIDLPAASSPDLPETVEDESAQTVISESPATSEDAASAPLMAWAEVLTDDRSGINLRADPAPDAERVGSAEEFEILEVLQGPETDPAGNAWYLVKSGGVTGWAFGDYLEATSEEATVAGPGVATGSFMYPVKRFTFTQGYGCSQYWWHYAYNAAWGCAVHNGIDLAAPYGTPIMAADGGVIEEAGWCDCGLGWYVKIDHENGFVTEYGHMSEYSVVPGQLVEKGEVIGYMGSSGNSTGSHLHFTTEYMGVDYNPFNYLP